MYRTEIPVELPIILEHDYVITNESTIPLLVRYRIRVSGKQHCGKISIDGYCTPLHCKSSRACSTLVILVVKGTASTVPDFMVLCNFYCYHSVVPQCAHVRYILTDS